MAENKEKIEISNSLSLFSYPIDNCTHSKYFSFILGKHNFYHSGIHLDSKSAVKSIADGTIVAYRYIDEYKIKDFDIDNATFPAELFVLFHSRLSDIDDYFEKNEQGDYVLKEKIKNDEKRKQDSLRFLNKLYSDSFVLLRHEVANAADEKIVFYSLYNHLKPLKSMTLEQKVNILNYYKSITIKVLKNEFYSYIEGVDKNGQKVEIPSEVKYTENKDYACVKWELNNKQYKGFIAKDKIKSLSGNYETKRPGKRTGVDLKTGEYYDKYTQFALLYSTDNPETRNVIFFIGINETVDVSKTDFDSYLNSNKNAVKVTYKNKPAYLFLTYKEEIKESYELLKSKLLKDRATPYSPNSSTVITISFTQGFTVHCINFVGQTSHEKLINQKNRILIPRLSTPCVLLESMFEVQEKSEKQVLGECFIPCETKVEYTTSDYKYINWTYNEKQNVSIVKESLLRTDIGETKRMLYSWEENAAENKNYISRSYYKDDKILIYNSEERSKRNVIAGVPKNTDFKIVNINKFIKIFTDTNENINKQGIQVQYGDNKSGYIYIGYEKDLTNKYTNYKLSQGKAGYGIDVKKHREDLFTKKDGGDDVSIIGKCKQNVINLFSTVESKNSSLSENLNFFELKFNKNEVFKLEEIYDKNSKISIKKNQILGYTGYSITKSEEENKTRIENEDATSLHFEVFCNIDASFLKKKVSMYKNKSGKDIHFPCYFKVNKDCNVKQGKLTTKTIKKDLFVIERISQKNRNNPFKNLFKNKDTSIAPFNLNLQTPDLETIMFIKNTCLEVLETGFIVDNEIFYKLKKTADIVDFGEEEYVNKKSIKWCSVTNRFISTETSDVVLNLYDYENKQIEGKSIPLYTDLPYFDVSTYSVHEKAFKDNPPAKVEKVSEPGCIDFKNLESDEIKKEEAELKLRRLRFYYIKQNNIPDFYVRKETVNSFLKVTYNNKEYIFVHDGIISEDEIFDEPRETLWTNEEEIFATKLGKQLSYNYEKVSEYTSFSINHSIKNTWLNVNGNYFINEKDVKDKVEGSPVGTVYYDDWDNFFNKITLSGFRYDEKKESRKDFLKKINLEEKVYTDPTSSITQLIRDNSFRVQNLYFERESEWTDSKELTKEYVNIDKNQKKEIEGYRKDLGFITDSFCRTTGISKKNIYFQPIAFLNHLDKVATPAEFNPYEGKTYNELLYGSFDPIYDDVDRFTTKVISNPGMATLFDEEKDKGFTPVEFNGVKYLGVNGFFNAQYKPYHSGYTEYWHEGIDFRGKTGATIVSLVSGTVIACGKRKNLEQGFIMIQSINDKSIYYLALHVDHNSLLVSIKDPVFPGKRLGQTVYLPDGDGNDVSHLHVSVIRYHGNKPIGNIIGTQGELYTWGERKPNQEIWEQMINPFNYNDPNTWKGRY